MAAPAVAPAVAGQNNVNAATFRPQDHETVEPTIGRYKTPIISPNYRQNKQRSLSDSIRAVKSRDLDYITEQFARKTQINGNEYVGAARECNFPFAARISSTICEHSFLQA